MESQTIELNFTDGRQSRIVIGEGWLNRDATSSKVLGSGPALPRKLLLVCDENTVTLAAGLERILGELDREVHREVVAAGEGTKSIQWLERLWVRMAELGLDRSAGVIAFGGGVVGDLAGMAAATFMRGLKWFAVPTTLVAQVDSALGGKVGVNLSAGKNLVGAFWQPTEVWIDPQLLGTLPEREYLSGLAEVVKYGVIADRELFDLIVRRLLQIKAREPHCLQQVIARCCQIKAEVVVADERESSGQRAKLNYGHTFGHAIEKVAGYGEYLHGEAVSIGMVWAARAARLLGMVSAEFEQAQLAVLRELGLPVDWLEAPVDRLLAAMKVDKKRAGGLPRLVLPREIGQVESCDWPGDNLVREAISGLGQTN